MGYKNRIIRFVLALVAAIVCLVTGSVPAEGAIAHDLPGTGNGAGAETDPGVGVGPDTGVGLDTSVGSGTNSSEGSDSGASPRSSPEPAADTLPYATSSLSSRPRTDPDGIAPDSAGSGDDPGDEPDEGPTADSAGTADPDGATADDGFGAAGAPSGAWPQPAFPDLADLSPVPPHLSAPSTDPSSVPSTTPALPSGPPTGPRSSNAPSAPRRTAPQRPAPAHPTAGHTKAGARHPTVAHAPRGTVTPVTTNPTRLGARLYDGLGFDACTAPDLATMSAWRESQYGAVGVYIGGRARYCAQPRLNRSWIHSVSAMGWRILPIYVGSQSSCATSAHQREFPIDPKRASAQGASEAADAVKKAAALGILRASPIYLDIEAYDTDSDRCTAPVITFVRSWSRNLRARGYLPGFYSSADSGIDRIEAARAAGLTDLPDFIWYARWGVDPDIYGEPALPDNVWRPHRRVHQFDGDVQESYGGYSLSIDRDLVDAPVAIVS